MASLLGRKMRKRLATTVFLFQLIFAQWVKSYPSRSCEQLEQEIVELVSVGALSSARLLALTSLSQAPECKHDIITAYVKTANEKLQDEHYLSYVYGAFHPATSKRPVARPDRGDCLYGHDDLLRAADEWDECCSILPGAEEQTVDLFGMSLDDKKSCITSNRCCELFVGSSSYLRLPALHEPALRVRVRSKNDNFQVLELEQDGFLRPFDKAGILWPSGYLMAQCVADPIRCGAPELQRALESSSSSGRPEAIELGAGVGAPSIALALYLQNNHYGPNNNGKAFVVATDLAPHAMALATVNAKANLAHTHVALARVNHTDIAALEAVKSKFSLDKQEVRGFAVVMGSSLESLFEATEDPQSRIWTILDVLLDHTNPHSIAVLTHTTTDPLQAPVDGSFRLLRKVSGSVFGMQARAGNASCFEISLFQRSKGTLKHHHEDL